MSDLRDRILAIVSKACFGSDDPCDVCAQRADAVMAVVQPAPDAKDKQIALLAFEQRGTATHRDLLQMELVTAQQRAEQAEATIARVTELALMGGQDPADIRRQIIGVLTQPNDPPKDTP